MSMERWESFRSGISEYQSKWCPREHPNAIIIIHLHVSHRTRIRRAAGEMIPPLFPFLQSYLTLPPGGRGGGGLFGRRPFRQGTQM